MPILRLLNNNTIACSNFINAVGTLVSKGFHDFCELDITTKNQVIGLLIKCLRDPHEFLVEHNSFNEFIRAFSDYLIFDCEDDKESYNKILLQKAIEYYEHDLDEYFSDLASNKYDN